MSHPNRKPYPTFLKTIHNPPSNASTFADLPPGKELKLEYIHGCSKKGTKGNIVHMDKAGHLVYPAAACGVVLDMENNTQDIFNKHTDDVVCIAKHPNGTIFATGQIGKDDMVYIWATENPAEPIAMLDTSVHFKAGGVFDVAFSNDGNKLAAVGGGELNSTLLVYEWHSGTLLGKAKAHTAEIFDLSFTPDDSKILLCGKDTAKFFDVNAGLTTRQAVFSPRGMAQTVYCACYDTNGNAICGVSDGSLYVFSSNKLVLKRQIHNSAVYSIYRTENGFITGSRDGKVIWWQFTGQKVEGVDDFKNIASLDLCAEVRSVVPSNVEQDVVYAAKMNGDIVKISNKNTISIMLVSHFGNHKDELWGLDTIKGTSMFVSAGDDGRLILWDYSTRKSVQQVKVTTKGDLRGVACSAGHIVTSTKFGTIFVFEFDGSTISRQPICNMRDGIEEIASLQFSPDGSILAAGSHDNFIYLYNTSNYSLIGKLQGHSSFVTHLDFTTDGNTLRSNSGDYEILLWDVKTRKQITHNADMEDLPWATVNCTLGWSVRGVWASNMDGTDVNAISVHYGVNLVAAAEDTGRVSLYHFPTATTKPKGNHYIGHCSHVTNVKFTEDGNYLLTAGGGDLTVFQWRIQ